MRRNLLVFLLLTLLPLLASAEQNDLKPIDCTQLMAWIAGGVSTPRLQHLLRERTIGFFPNEATIKLLIRAGAEPVFIRSLRVTKHQQAHVQQSSPRLANWFAKSIMTTPQPPSIR